MGKFNWGGLVIVILLVIVGFVVSGEFLQGRMKLVLNEKVERLDIAVESDHLISFPVSYGDVQLVKRTEGEGYFDQFQISEQIIRKNYLEPLEISKRLEPQKNYKVAFVVVNAAVTSEIASFDENEMEAVDNIRKALPKFFSLATYNQASLDTSYPVVKISGDPIESADAFSAVELFKVYLKSFYLSHPDDFDFIYFYTQNPTGQGANYFPISQIQGGTGCMNSVGQLLFNQDDCLECFNHSGEFYSDNLKGVISMRTVNGYFPAYKKNGKLAFASYQQHIQNYIDITDNLYPGALQDLNDSFGVDFLEVVLALHEIEHAWSFSPINDYSKLLKVDELSQDQKVVYEKLRDMTNQLNHAHFGKLVGSSDGLDPHDAVPFIVTDEGKIKICPEDLPPLQPYRFSDIVLYFMGLDNGWDFDSEIQFLNYDQQAEVNLEGVKDGCFLYEIDEPINYSTKEENEFESFIDTITINEIGSIWQPYQCEQKQ